MTHIQEGETMRIQFIIVGTIITLAIGIGFASANDLSIILTILGNV